MTTQFQNQQVHELQSGAARVLIAPDFGARLLIWEVNGEPIIFWPHDADWSSRETIAHARGGNPILFPFIARHYVDGELGKWRDQNGIVRTLPMHGFAREMEFDVVEREENSIRMRLLSNDATREMYPFDWRFDVIYTLRGSTLETTFETENTGNETLPYYAGHHFYFAIPHGERKNWAIELPCKTWGRQDAQGNPVLERAQSTHATLSDENLIDRFQLDFYESHVHLQNNETGQSLRIEWDAEYSDLWHDVTTWTQSPNSNFYCVEPWLGLPNAIHHGNGLRLLESGQTQTAACRIRTE